MKETVTQIDEQIQSSKSKQGKYLTFAFLENNHCLELEVVGWTQFQIPENKSENTRGVVHLWGHEIPVIQTVGLINLTETTCIIIFEFYEPCRHYQAILVDAIANVMSIAEKDPATVTIVETQAADCLGGTQVQYNIIKRPTIHDYDLVETDITDGTDRMATAPQPPLELTDIHAADIDPHGEKKGQFEFSGNVLVVEDVESHQLLIKRLLEPTGLQVTIAKDGYEAVKKVKAHKFDLILMDIIMPVMNGYEATKALREQGITTPIIALTAMAMKDDEEKCLQAGCDDYLSKPFDCIALLKTIDKYLTTTQDRMFI